MLALLDVLEKQGADAAEITYQMGNYIRTIAREKGIPLQGTFELTPLCNLNCKMCYVHLKADALHTTNHRLLTGRQWQHIMEQAVREGMLYATLTGGEALMHPDFDAVYQYLQSQGVEITLKSNGLLLDEKRMAFLEAHPPQEIQISLYGTNDDIYESVTGKRCFQQVINAIKRVKASKIALHVSITPNRHMKDDISSILALLDDMKIKYGVNSSLIRPRQETGRELDDMDLTLEEYIALYKKHAAMRKQPLTPCCIQDIPEQPTGRKPISGLPCGAGRNSFSIRWDGRMYPCLSLTDVGADVTSTPFSAAWKLVRAAVENHSFPGECMACELRPICTPCVVAHAPDGWTEHANPALCKRARRLLEEGLVHLDKKKKEEQHEETVYHPDRKKSHI